jgi:hypothetical protein
MQLSTLGPLHDLQVESQVAHLCSSINKNDPTGQST